MRSKCVIVFSALAVLPIEMVEDDIGLVFMITFSIVIYYADIY